MNPQLCGLLVLVSWIISDLNSFVQSFMVLHLSFCTNLEIPHFFCETDQLVHLAYSDTFLNNMVLYFVAALLGGGTLTEILYSYCKIVSSIRASYLLRGSTKHFLPVHIISLLSSYFILHSWEYFLALLFIKTHI
jgi:olfactory receptor